MNPQSGRIRNPGAGDAQTRPRPETKRKDDNGKPPDHRDQTLAAPGGDIQAATRLQQSTTMPRQIFSPAPGFPRFHRRRLPGLLAALHVNVGECHAARDTCEVLQILPRRPRRETLHRNAVAASTATANAGAAATLRATGCFHLQAASVEIAAVHASVDSDKRSAAAGALPDGIIRIAGVVELQERESILHVDTE